MVKTRQPELPHAGDGKADQQRERSLSYLNAIQAGMCCKRAGRAPANPQRMVNAGICRNAAGAIWRGIIRPIRGARSRSLTTLTQDRSRRARRGARRKPSTGHGPLLPPLMVFGAVVLFGAAYVTYVLWPRWPDSPVTLNAPTVPIVVSGTVFNIEPAAIRMNVQRRPGAHERVDLSYMWPSLTPPDHAIKPTVGAPIRAKIWSSSRTRPSISWRAARKKAPRTPAPASWSGASARPTSPCAFRATGWTTGRTSPAESIA